MEIPPVKQVEDVEVLARRPSNHLGIYLIRDYLNFEPQNGLTKSFEAHGTTFQNVAFCARIVSMEHKNESTKLVVDDGTSAILCVLNASGSVGSEDEEEHNLSSAHQQPSRLGQLFEAQSQRLRPQKGQTFGRSSLGSPVFVVGKLRHFEGKNFVFASSVRRVTEEYFVHFLNFALRGAEFRKFNNH